MSVVIPVRDARPHLEAALASVRRQTLRDFEVVCVDDGSVDGSSEILDRHAAEDGRFRILHRARIGLVAALNLLHEEARAPLLSRFDADDVMHPRRLELQTGLLDERAETDVVASLVRHFPQSDVKEGNRVYETWLNGLVEHDEIVRDMFVELPLPNPSVTMRAHVFERAGGFVDNDRPEDYDFWLRAWQAGCRFAKVPRVLHYWREHALRVTRTDPRYSVEAFLKAKLDGLLRGPLKEPRPFVVWGAGMMGRRLLRLLLRADRRPHAILDIDPKKIGRTRHGIPVTQPDAVRPGTTLVLGAVGSRGARELIRTRLREWGLEETRDFWMCA